MWANSDEKFHGLTRSEMLELVGSIKNRCDAVIRLHGDTPVCYTLLEDIYEDAQSIAGGFCVK